MRECVPFMLLSVFCGFILGREFMKSEVNAHLSKLQEELDRKQARILDIQKEALEALGSIRSILQKEKV